jgi:hypothetical protein
MTPQKAFETMQMKKVDIVSPDKPQRAKNIGIHKLRDTERQRAFDKHAAVLVKTVVGFLADKEKTKFGRRVGANINDSPALPAELRLEYDKSNIFMRHRQCPKLFYPATQQLLHLSKACRQKLPAPQEVILKYP